MPTNSGLTHGHFYLLSVLFSFFSTVAYTSSCFLFAVHISCCSPLAVTVFIIHRPINKLISTNVRDRNGWY